MALTMMSQRNWSPRTIILLVLLLGIVLITFGTRPRNPYLASWRTDPKVDESVLEHTSFSLSEIKQSRLLEPDEASELCARRRWKRWPNRTHRKVYDLMLINTELDWLEIRMAELENEVDYFVVVEAATTFTNLSKPTHLKDNWDRFARWHGKMIYHLLDSTDMVAQDAWDRERFQRDSMYDQVLPFLQDEKEIYLGDVILVSDVDEIPRPSTIQALRNCQFPQRLTISSRFYYYSFQWLHRDGQEWTAPSVTYYLGLNTVRPAELRDGRNEYPRLHNAGWHCSSCLPTLSDFVNKITSFSHTEFNEPEFTNRSNILRRVRSGVDLFDRVGESYDRVDDNPDVPSYLLRPEQRQKYAYLLDRDPRSGNFLDYTEEDSLGG